MERGNGLSVARPRSPKVCRVSSSCWKWPWEKALSLIFPGPRGKSSHYCAPARHQKEDSSSVSSSQHFTYEWDSRPRKDYDEYSQCEVGYCHSQRLPDTTYCMSHICRTNRCGDVRAIGSLHCLAHKCRSCNAKAKTKNNYCEAHQCLAPSCLRGKESDQDWCRRHVCQWEICTMPPSKGSRHCDYHTCAAGGCVYKVLSTGNWLGDYCCCHTCSADGCLLEVASTGTFCAGHGCLIPGCPNPRLWDGIINDRGELGSEWGCCRFHTCVQRGCFGPTSKVGAFCDLHTHSCSGYRTPRISHATGQALRDCVGNHHHHHHRRRSRLGRGTDLAKGDDEELNSLGFQSLQIGILCSSM
ncbi:hypothetical protein F4782DRAFT_61458 [Xylaria castorea]|nr:hypothetical protein F4782DRAFT_61458 [Xylaria castorea]